MAQTKDLRIFPDSLRRLYPTEVCDFIERYTAQCLSWNVKNYPLYRKLSDDKVFILDGDMQLLLTLPDTFQFTLIRYDDKAYEAIWENELVFLRILFPIKYELLLGKTKNELEQELAGDILSARDTNLIVKPQLEPMNDSIIYITTPQLNYQIPEFTNTAYFYRQDNDYCIILDTAHIEYSIHNILLVPSENNPIIRVDQRLYGYKHKKFTMTLGQWLAYCRQENLNLYVAIKSVTNESYVAVIVAENKDLAYNHVLTMSIPCDFLTNDNAVWETQLRGYIPTHNVKDMYKQYKIKN